MDRSDDYYRMLGVDPSADGDEIRRAWKRHARVFHPDRAGAGAKDVFQRISAAYTVLSDPVARAAYDRRRAPVAARTPPGASAENPTAAPTGRARAPSVLLHRLSGPLNALLACGVAKRGADGVIELALAPEEVSQGGMATIAMRVRARCEHCAMDADPSDCSRCGATGEVDELFSAWLAIPPGVADGTILTPSAQLRGVLAPVSFRARVR